MCAAVKQCQHKDYLALKFQIFVFLMYIRSLSSTSINKMSYTIKLAAYTAIKKHDKNSSLCQKSNYLLSLYFKNYIGISNNKTSEIISLLLKLELAHQNKWYNFTVFINEICSLSWNPMIETHYYDLNVMAFLMTNKEFFVQDFKNSRPSLEKSLLGNWHLDWGFKIGC